MKRTIIHGAIAALACLALIGCVRQSCNCPAKHAETAKISYRVAPPPGKSKMPKATKALLADLEKALQAEGIAGDSGWTVQPIIVENPKKTGRLAVDASVFAPDGTPVTDFYVRCWDTQHWSGCSAAVAEEIAGTLAREADPARR